MSAKAANRYASAFLEAAVEKNDLEKAHHDMVLIFNTLRGSSDLRLFLKSPVIKKDQKSDVLVSIFGEKITEISNSLLRVLSDKGRVDILEDIASRFIDLYNKYNGIIEIDVNSAVEIDKNQLGALISKLENVTGKKVKAKTTVNKELIGGILVRIDDTVIDGSVKYKLNQLKNRFASASVD